MINLFLLSESLNVILSEYILYIEK